MEEKKIIKCKCLFCFSDKFIVDEDAPYFLDNKIQCANCGQLNDYNCLLQVVKRKGLEWTNAQLEKELKKVFKKLK